MNLDRFKPKNYVDTTFKTNLVPVLVQCSMPPVRLMADLENILEFDQNETNTLDNVIETELSKQKYRAIS